MEINLEMIGKPREDSRKHPETLHHSAFVGLARTWIRLCVAHSLPWALGGRLEAFEDLRGPR